MDKQEFYQFIKERIHNYLPDDYQQAEVMIQDVQVSEGITKPGLILVMKDREQVPVLNLESYYEEAQVDAVKEDVLEGLAKDYVGMCEGKPRLPLVKMTAEEFFGRLHTTVINFENNRQELSNMPYFKLHDLAIIPMMALEENLSRPVTLTHARIIGISGDTILQEAMKNHTNRFPAVLIPMQNEYKGIDAAIPIESEEKVSDNKDIFVLKSINGNCGAALLANLDILEKVEHMIGSDYYIMVDNIEQLMVVPEHLVNGADQLYGIQSEHNQMILKESILSEQIYQFKGDTKTLEVYSQDASKEQQKIRNNDTAR